MSVWCVCCNGCGWVIWDHGVPRPLIDNEESNDPCPACDGSGVEPGGSEEADNDEGD